METKEFKYKIGDIIKYYGRYKFHNDLLIIDMRIKSNWWDENVNIYLCETKEHERFWYDEEYLDSIQVRDVDEDKDINYLYEVGDKLIYTEEVWDHYDNDYDSYRYEVLVKGKKYMPPDHDIYLPESCYKEGKMYLCEFVCFDPDENNSRVWISESDLEKSYSSDEDEEE